MVCWLAQTVKMCEIQFFSPHYPFKNPSIGQRFPSLDTTLLGSLCLQIEWLLLFQLTSAKVNVAKHIQQQSLKPKLQTAAMMLQIQIWNGEACTNQRVFLVPAGIVHIRSNILLSWFLSVWRKHKTSANSFLRWTPLQPVLWNNQQECSENITSTQKSVKMCWLNMGTFNVECWVWL